MDLNKSLRKITMEALQQVNLITNILFGMKIQMMKTPTG